MVLGSVVAVAPRVVVLAAVVVDHAAVEIPIPVDDVCACEVLEGADEYTPIGHWTTNPDLKRETLKKIELQHTIRVKDLDKIS